MTLERRGAPSRTTLVVCLVCLAGAATPGCGDDSGSMPGLGNPTGDGGSAGAGSADGASTADGAPTTGGGGEIGPTSRIRLVNIVPDTTFDVWGADIHHEPVRIAQNIMYATASGYIDTPINVISGNPELVLMPAGEAPQNVPTWEIDTTGPDRSYVVVTELDTAGEQATLIIARDDDHLTYGTLDETDINSGDPGQVSLHVSYNLFDLGGTTAPSFAVVGQPCLFNGSTGLALPWSIAPGISEVGVFDTQAVPDCTTTPLATGTVTGASDEHALVVLFHEGETVRVLTTGIPL